MMVTHSLLRPTMPRNVAPRHFDVPSDFLTITPIPQAHIVSIPPTIANSDHSKQTIVA